MHATRELVRSTFFAVPRHTSGSGLMSRAPSYGREPLVGSPVGSRCPRTSGSGGRRCVRWHDVHGPSRTNRAGGEWKTASGLGREDGSPRLTGRTGADLGRLCRRQPAAVAVPVLVVVGGGGRRDGDLPARVRRRRAPRPRTPRRGAAPGRPALPSGGRAQSRRSSSCGGGLGLVGRGPEGISAGPGRLCVQARLGAGGVAPSGTPRWGSARRWPQSRGGVPGASSRWAGPPPRSLRAG